MRIELRYCKQSDQYYIQMRGEEYNKIHNKMCHLSKLINSLSRPAYADRKEEVERLRAKHQLLMQKRREALCYVRVAREDIPEGVTARPIKKIDGVLDVVSPQRYRELLESLREGGKPLEADTSVPTGGSAGVPAGRTGERAG